MKYSIAQLDRLVEQFEKLPGIGSKTAQRLAYFVLNQDKSYAEKFSKSMLEAVDLIKKCSCCHNLTDQNICSICQNESRDKNVICVVEDSKDVMAFERTGEYFGVYHVLNGLISPMNGISVDQLYIKELLNRVCDADIKEIIMATSPTLEGEATALYLSKLLKPFEVKVTRLASGIPVGGNLEFADEVTLYKALEGRNEIF